MMHIPEYWSVASRTLRRDKRQVTLKRFGWSDVSQQEALRHAEQRLLEAIRQFESGQRVHRFDHKVAYNGAEGLPIREEVVQRTEGVVITRNVYGALCLNTPDVLFADVDFELPYIRPTAYNMIANILIAMAIAWLVKSALVFVIALIGLVAFDFFVFTPRLRLWQQKRTSGVEQLAMSRIQSFSQQHPDWHLRVYQTPAGYRVLVMHRTFDPLSAEVGQFFEQLACDPIYILMCKNQQCFRARVSPKPWRIGLKRVQSKATYPYTPETSAKRQQWVATYQPQAQKFASCRFIAQMGSLTTDPQAERVRLLHDQLCQSDTQLPLA